MLNADWQLARCSVDPASEPSRRQFFFTEQLPQDARNVHHAYAPVEKLGVVIDDSAPWEDGAAASFCSTILRCDSGSLRLYYTYHSTDHSQMRIAVAESDDGLEWEKAPLGQETIDGQATNRLVFAGLPREGQARVGQPQVLRTREGGWRMYFWKHGNGHLRYTVAESNDGLAWTVPDIDAPVLYHPGDAEVRARWTRGLDVEDTTAGEPVGGNARARALLTNDATHVYYNEQLDRYECYSVWLTPSIPERRVEADNAPGVLRLIQRRLSDDGLQWSAPELVLAPDGKDPWDQQFYHLAVQWHRDWLIGSLGNYRVEDGQQTQDLELVFSRDGRSWERPLRGGFIPRDPEARDSMGVYPPCAWIERDGGWLCLYTGTARRHNEHAKTDLPASCIMGASLARDRFVGLAAGSVTGGFLSEPFFPDSGKITIDATVNGWLRAELCDLWGRQREGCRLMDADPLTGDSESHQLTWRGQDAAALTHQGVRLRFEFNDSVVYSIGF